MFNEYSRHDYQPMTYWGRIPVYVTTLIVAACVAGLILGTVEFVSHWNVLGGSMALDPSKIWHDAQLWRIVTYPFLSFPSFWIFLALFFLAYFGVQVEQYLGRRRMGVLFVLSLLIPVLVYSLFWLFVPTGATAGANYLYISVIVAFATLYPNTIVWFFIPMKWFAALLIFLGLVYPLAARNFAEFFAFGGVCGGSFGFVRWLQLGAEMPSLKLGSLFRRKPKFRVVRHEEVEDDSPLGSVDLILEKISKHGIGSLTAKEKAALEKGRSELLKREKGK